MAQTITPNLWFPGNAKQAVDFYTAIFPDGEVLSTAYYPESAADGLADFQRDLAGKELVINFKLGGLGFAAINAGPDFVINPSISLMVNFDPARDTEAREHLDGLWTALVEGGQVLMPLNEYDFSPRYGWVQDRFGMSWQLILTRPEGEPRPLLLPCLLFGGTRVNQAEAAIRHYLAAFTDSRLGTLERYGQATGPAKAGSVMFADFMIGGQWLAAMDAAVEQDFSFNEAVSLAVSCRDQAEIDHVWDQLSAVPEAEQCGWCKDRFGISWQVVPAAMEELMQKPGAFARMMEMKKLVIADF